MTKYSKEELAKRSKEYFESHPEAKSYLATEDGHFYGAGKETNAFNHASSAGLKVFSITQEGKVTDVTDNLRAKAEVALGNPLGKQIVSDLGISTISDSGVPNGKQSNIIAEITSERDGLQVDNEDLKGKLKACENKIVELQNNIADGLDEAGKILLQEREDQLNELLVGKEKNVTINLNIDFKSIVSKALSAVKNPLKKDVKSEIEGILLNALTDAVPASADKTE